MTQGAQWRALVRELFSPAMRERWGWGKTLQDAHWVTTGAPTEGAVAAIRAGGLDIPYYEGHIEVDFGQRTVICFGVDQKTPADERWALTPTDEWWQRALECEWPLRAPRPPRP